MTIEARTVRAGYVRDVPIVRDVSLTVEAGSVVTIIGPNGSGKSTLMKAIIGAVPLSAGEVLVDGTSMAGLPVHRRAVEHGLAYVPQVDNVFGPLSVRENLDLGGVSLPRHRRRQRIDELVATYPVLEQRITQRADTLSGGERQILTIARALMTNPRHLLLDEPSAGLSPVMTQQLFAMLTEIRQRDGVTILLVEQNAVQSLAVSDRGLVLVAGQIALEASAADMLADSRLSELYLGGTPGTLDEPDPDPEPDPDHQAEKSLVERARANGAATMGEVLPRPDGGRAAPD